MGRLFKLDFGSEHTYVDLTKISYLQLLDEPNSYINLEIRFSGDAYIELTARQHKPESLANEEADLIRKIHRDLVFAWETYDAQQTVQVNVTPSDILSGIQSGPPITMPKSFSGTVNNGNNATQND